jgi:hypothetical protein
MSEEELLDNLADEGRVGIPRRYRNTGGLKEIRVQRN